MANKKLILGGLVFAAGVAYMMKDKLFGGTAAPTVASLEGKAVTADGTAAWYRIVNGQKMGYPNFDLYVKDGSPQLVKISLAQLNSIPDSKLNFTFAANMKKL